MGPAVEHVDEWDWKRPRTRASQKAIERLSGRCGRCFCNGERGGDERICSHALLVCRAVQLKEKLVNGELVAGVPAFQATGDVFVHLRRRFLDALPAIAFSGSISKFPRLVGAG